MGKDGTVVGICPVTDDDNYYVVPLVLSASCKTETGNELAAWIEKFLDRYYCHVLGRQKYGVIIAVATDENLHFVKCDSNYFSSKISIVILH